MANEKEFLVRDLTIDDEYDTILATASIQEAALKMKENGIPDLVVIDDDNQYQGVIADFDIVTGLVAEGLSPEKSKVTEIMYTIEPVTKTTPVSAAFSRMRDLDVSVVPVLENDEVIGVATITDCWGFLPEEYEDAKGLIPVSNPRLFNYSFTLLMILFYLVFGLVSPLIGITGFLKAPIAGSAVYSGTYYLFDAHGGGFWASYFDMGLFVPFVYGLVYLLLSIFTAFAIYQWAYADYQVIQVKRNWQIIGLVIGIINILIEWVLFTIFVMLETLRIAETQVTFDVVGLLFSGLAIICLLAAVSRDVIFRESTPSTAKEV